MQPMKNIVFENAYQKNARTLLDKLNSAEAILVGAAAGMSASCGYNFFYQNDAIFQKYLGDFHKKYGFTGAFNGFYYHYPSPEAHWAFLVRMGYMENMSVLQDSLTTISWNSSSVKTIIL